MYWISKKVYRKGRRTIFTTAPLIMKNIVVLTGAGISAESGIKTFRGGDGLWEEHSLEDVATPEGFMRNPRLVQDFYNKRRQALLSVKENAGHIALAQFEERHCKAKGNSFLLVSQNIDDLHERAGTKNMIHMHGELLKKRCGACNTVSKEHASLSVEDECEFCKKKGSLRPHVVWFGEMPLEMEAVYAALAQADLFVSIGTSGSVYPAAGFVELAREAQAQCVELNLEPSEGTRLFDRVHHGPATQVVPDFFKSL